MKRQVPLSGRSAANMTFLRICIMVVFPCRSPGVAAGYQQQVLQRGGPRRLCGPCQAGSSAVGLPRAADAGLPGGKRCLWIPSSLTILQNLRLTLSAAGGGRQTSGAIGRPAKGNSQNFFHESARHKPLQASRLMLEAAAVSAAQLCSVPLASLGTTRALRYDSFRPCCARSAL